MNNDKQNIFTSNNYKIDWKDATYRINLDALPNVRLLYAGSEYVIDTPSLMALLVRYGIAREVRE